MRRLWTNTRRRVRIGAYLRVREDRSHVPLVVLRKVRTGGNSEHMPGANGVFVWIDFAAQSRHTPGSGLLLPLSSGSNPPPSYRPGTGTASVSSLHAQQASHYGCRRNHGDGDRSVLGG
eukprot:3653470-Rhodomonas_salina.2